MTSKSSGELREQVKKRVQAQAKVRPKGRPKQAQKKKNILEEALTLTVKVGDLSVNPQDFAISWTGLWPQEIVNYIHRAIDVSFGQRQLVQYQEVEKARAATGAA